MSFSSSSNSPSSPNSSSSSISPDSSDSSHGLTINEAGKLAKSATFRFQKIEDAHVVANFLASACPNPRLAVIGIVELIMNAIEHGNLGISYEEKTQLQKEGKWAAELDHRFALPENKGKYVEVEFKRVSIEQKEELHIRIKDQGEGFDWQNFEKIPQEKTSQHGRGLTIAKSIVFSRLEFNEKGNEVLGVISASFV